MLFLDQQKPPLLWSSNLFTAPANAHSRCRFFVFLLASTLPLALPPPPALGTQATRRRSHSRSVRRPCGGAQARDISDGGAVPGLSSSSAAPPPASRQSPRALASGPPHTARRPCVRPYRLRWTINGCAARRAPRAEAAWGGRHREGDGRPTEAAWMSRAQRGVVWVKGISWGKGARCLQGGGWDLTAQIT
jgi:hypothetical protein